MTETASNTTTKFSPIARPADIVVIANESTDCEYIATGHYARIEEYDGKYILKKAFDETKDQSYVLYSLTQEQLAHTLFPLGNMRKTEVRKIADKNGFINADKPDSQDICFVPNGKYAEFLERFTGKTYPAGCFVSEDGTVLGEHKGIIRYTIGQHKGLGIPSAKPLYVKEINANENAITLCEVQNLYSKEVTACDFHWISEEQFPISALELPTDLWYN